MSRPRRCPVTLFTALASLAFAGAAPAAPVEWKVADGGNGHYYELVRPRASPAPAWTWTAARDAAAATSFGGVPGHLATVTSQSELQFINSAQFGSWFAWIGGIQAPDPTPGTGADQGWSWITGEPWGYAPWLNGEPNDWAGSDERYLSTWVGASNSGWWNDNSDAGTPSAYIVEFPVIVPEPSAAAALSLTFGSLALLRRTWGTRRSRCR